jgi:hypothetical protein
LSATRVEQHAALLTGFGAGFGELAAPMRARVAQLAGLAGAALQLPAAAICDRAAERTLAEARLRHAQRISGMGRAGAAIDLASGSTAVACARSAVAVRRSAVVVRVACVRVAAASVLVRFGRARGKR